MAQLHKDAPTVLYKFRNNIQRDVQCLLVDRELFLASPLTWNDPFDCYPTVTVPPTKQWPQLIEQAVANAPQGMAAETRKMANLLLTSQVHRQHFRDELYERDLAKLGVFTLSASRDHSLLWAHYAANYRGFAVGYRARREGDFEPIPGWPVKYTMDRPQMPCLGEPDWESILHTKSEHWSHEQEWRYVRLANDGGVGSFAVPEGCIVEVCLGPRMAKKDRAAVVGAATSLQDRPRILQATLMQERFGMTFDPID